MIKPKRLKKGDKIAVVSLSWGGLGDPDMVHKYIIAKERLENEFGLEVVAMPNALKGSQFLYEHPEARADDWMAALKDDSVKGIFCAIGGDDTIRLLPYIDYDVIRNHPKIFMGYSDTTANHFMMHKAGVVSFYGPCVMGEFGEYVDMFDYTRKAVENILFQPCEDYEIKSADHWTKDYVPWTEANIYQAKQFIAEEHGYEVLQGSGVITGQILGGCIDVFPMMIGTEIWPVTTEWKDKILLLETSEKKPTPNQVTYYLRNLGVQGIFDQISGIIVGKPQAEVYYEEYKAVYKKVLKEFHQEYLPVLYNVNVGHAAPIGILPLGTNVQVDFTHKKITIAETVTQS